MPMKPSSLHILFLLLIGLLTATAAWACCPTQAPPVAVRTNSHTMEQEQSNTHSGNLCATDLCCYQASQGISPDHTQGILSTPLRHNIPRLVTVIPPIAINAAPFSNPAFRAPLSTAKYLQNQVFRI